MENNQESFSGDKKVGASALHTLEQRFIAWATSRVPKSIETYHLTLCTAPICVLIVIFSALAHYGNIQWLWGVSAMIALQWITDSLDGAVGRARNTGLIKWGYFMDHLLDYFFLTAVMIGYTILLPDNSKWLFFFVFALFAGFMVNAYLMMATTNKFRISYLGFGPTEIRLLFIAINALIVIFGKTYIAFTLPYVLGFAFLGFLVVIFRESKELWVEDMKNKANIKK